MQFRPTQGAAHHSSISLFRKVLFGAVCLASLICIFVLISFRNNLHKAMSGELLTNETTDGIVTTAQSSFMENVFNYFGNVTFLFPLVFVFIGYKLFIKKIALKEIDFFVIGLFILGFNILVIGLCSLFSGLVVDTETSLGGFLGYFFMSMFDSLPFPIGKLLPALVTLLGLFLFTSKGPFWYFDKIGNFIFGFFDKDKKQDNNKNEKQEPQVNTQEDDSVLYGNIKLDTKNGELKEPFQTNLDFSTKKKAEENTTSDLFKSTSFSSGSLPAFGEKKKIFPSTNNEQSSIEKPRHNRTRSAVAHRREPEVKRIEPEFGSIGNFSADSNALTLNSTSQEGWGAQEESSPYITPGVQVPEYKKSSDASTSSTSSTYSNSYGFDNTSEDANSGPSTYISGVNAPNVAPSSNQNYDDGSTKTIIKDSRNVQEPVVHNTVKKTIITRLENSSDNQSSSYSKGYGADYSNATEPKASTIVYKAGADHLPPTEVVGNPSRRSEVSTVITRTTIPTVNVPNNEPKVSISSDGSSVSGEYSQPSSVITGAPTLSEDNKAYGEATTTSSMLPSQGEISENVINFTDLTKSQDSSKIEVENLSSAFVPSSDESDEELSIADTQPIKESDSSYEQYSKVARGVLTSQNNVATAPADSNSHVNSSKVNNENTSSSENKVNQEPLVTPYQGVSQSIATSTNQNVAEENKSGDDKLLTEALHAQQTGALTQSSQQQTQATEPMFNPYAPLPEKENSTLNSVIESGYSANTQNSASVMNINPEISSSERVNSVSSNTPANVMDGSRYESKPPFESMNTFRPNNISNKIEIKGSNTNGASKATVSYAKATETSPSKFYGKWRPSFDLLEQSQSQEQVSAEEISEKSACIDKFMSDFGVKAKVEQTVSGPVITRYDISLEAGTKSKTIVNLETDMQRSLMSQNINIIEVVPGTPYVGIEVPNDKRQMIRLGDIIDSEEFVHSKAKLPMCLGVDTVGIPVIADLADAPHLLIAGTTGSGKSAGLNSMLVSLLFARSPAELRLIMVDPKTVEFSQYQNLPHLLTPIITDPDSTVASLAWLIKEMERRYKLLSLMNLSKISQLNDFIKEKNLLGEKVYDPMWCENTIGIPPELKPVPYIVLVIDEFADLMAVASVTRKKDGNTPEALIARLTAKARAAGIHLILATQTPRADIVTGAIKANMPSHIAYTVQNSMESRIVLDETGAEKLLGNGDMLVKYQQLNRSQMFRAQGPFTSNQDVEKVVSSWIQQAGEPEYVEGITESEEEENVESEDSDGSAQQLDAKFDQVVEYARSYCSSNKRLSVSELQTAFGFGYNRARKIHRQMQAQQIIDDKGFLIQ